MDTKYYHFAIDLASLASRRDYLNLDKWLQDHIKSDGEPFLTACLEFLDEKITQKLYPEEKIYPQSVLLSYDTVLIFIKVINYYIRYFYNYNCIYNNIFLLVIYIYIINFYFIK